MTKSSPGGDTTLGGANRDFPSTCWSRFVGDAPPGEAPRQAAVEELARLYWKPIYAYVRALWAKSNEDAKDLTQDFFAWMIETDFLGRADPSRGRFRAFVKVALRHYLSNEARDEGRLKRGGGRTIIGLDEAMGNLAGTGVPDPKGRSPEEALDDEWTGELLARADKLLEEKFRRSGEESFYRVWRDYYFAEADEPEYRHVAERHGIAESDVLQRLRRAREAFRAIIVDLVSETVRGPDELKEEMRTLFGKERP